MLQIVDKDWHGMSSFVDLHIKYKRALPHMWANYTTAIAMFDITRSRSEYYFMPLCLMNILHNERRLAPLFTRSNVSKIGFNCVTNRLQNVSKRSVLTGPF